MPAHDHARRRATKDRDGEDPTLSFAQSLINQRQRSASFPVTRDVWDFDSWTAVFGPQPWGLGWLARCTSAMKIGERRHDAARRDGGIALSEALLDGCGVALRDWQLCKRAS